MASDLIHGSLPSAPPAPPEPDQSVRAAPAETPRADREPAFVKQRLHSLDAYRGLIMVTLAFNGFGLAATATNHLRAEGPSTFWATVHHHFEHVEWVGCGYWDLIQPSFMFMVGVAMAFSYAKRRQQGQSYPRLLGHAVWRSLLLIFLGIFLISNWSRSTVWSLMNVLTQIGLGYTFLFLLWGRSLRVQAVAAAAILGGTWLLYVLYPAPGIYPDGAPEVGVSRQWARTNLAGVGPAWHKNANVGQAIDLWLVNQLPQRSPYTYNRGGYQTLNFLPSLATMLFGLMCGELLRSRYGHGRRLAILTAAGLAGLGAGWLLDATGVCPLIKRIWTPAWALYSAGWCCLILAGLYAVVDALGYRRWAWPLVVVGVNSIAIYSMSMLLKPWVASTLRTHLGQDIFDRWGPLWAPTVQAVLVGLMFWLACWWMYRNKVFIRI